MAACYAQAATNIIMKNKLTLLILQLFFSSPTFSQKLYNNSVRLNFGAFILPGVISTIPGNQIGITCDRKVFKSLYFSASYQQWQRWADRKFVGQYIVEEPDYLRNISKGKLVWRKYYKMLDASVLYKRQFKKQNIISGGLGVSYCWGRNVYIDNYVLNPPLEILYDTYAKDVHYWGIVPQLSYDYLFLKSRLCAGVDIRARYYTHRAPAQYDYGVHVGVHF